MVKHNFGFNFNFEDLLNNKKLKKLDRIFLRYLKNKNKVLYKYVKENREIYLSFSEKYGNERSELIQCALILEQFIIELFPQDFSLAYTKLKTQQAEKNRVFIARKLFVNKYVKNVRLEELAQHNFDNIRQQFFTLLNIASFEQDVIVSQVLKYVENPEVYSEELKISSLFGAFILQNEDTYRQFHDQTLFFKAKKTNFLNLIETVNKDIQLESKDMIHTARDGFNFYNFIDEDKSKHNSNYCAKCHPRKKDTCRVGEISLDEEHKDELYKKNPLDIPLEGCPLGMHISQMHILHEEGNSLAGLNIITINNPLVAGTGYSICNDCRTSCIFQKQETVDTPMVETQILNTILNLPWGLEIYALLTKWHPLRFYRPYPKFDKKGNILVVGMGPSGYSLAYSLALEGCNVFGIDTLKIEPLKENLHQPIINYQDIKESLEERVIYGFGGVSEYGITSRWDKNYLKVIRIILERIPNFKMMGSTRFGSLINFNNAENLGFNHIALCCGTGKSKLLDLPNTLTSAVKTSSEFLMSLELGAYKKENLFNLQLQLPCIILGAGLTAVDCATEAMVYYKRQLEKHVPKYLSLCNKLGKQYVHNNMSDAEICIINEFVEHYNILEAIKKDYPKDKQKITNALKNMGGVKIIYKESMNQCSAYKNNFNELDSALKQGVIFMENLSTKSFNYHNDKLNNLILTTKDGNDITIKAKTVILALGTSVNNAVLEEFNSIFTKSEINLQSSLNKNNIEYKGKKLSIILKKLGNHMSISYLGDMHPSFSGSVVKAMASAFYGYEPIINSLRNIKSKQSSFLNKINKFLETKLSTKIVAKNLMEIKIKSKAISSAFLAGQFFKLQALEDTIEPIIITGVEHNIKKHTVKSYLHTVGSSSKALMELDPSSITVNSLLGSPTDIPKNTNVLLIGEYIFNNSLLVLLPSLYENGCNITYVANFGKLPKYGLKYIRRYCQNYYLCNDNNYMVTINDLTTEPSRDPTKMYGLTMVSTTPNTALQIQAIYKDNNKIALASLHPNMNCASRGICSTCLQEVVNDNGVISYIYVCVKQDQILNELNVLSAKERLKQNSLQEKISDLYIIEYINTIK